MPGRVREFNSIQAAAIAASLGIPVPGWGQAPVNVAINLQGAQGVQGNMPPAGAVPGPVVGAPPYPQPPMPVAMAPAYPTAVVQAAACPRCQRTNPPGARFCIGCGQVL
jgi:hypothetical protein